MDFSIIWLFSGFAGLSSHISSGENPETAVSLRRSGGVESVRSLRSAGSSVQVALPGCRYYCKGMSIGVA